MGTELWPYWIHPQATYAWLSSEYIHAHLPSCHHRGHHDKHPFAESNGTWPHFLTKFIEDDNGKSAVYGTRTFQEKGGTISRIIVPTWYIYAPMNKLAIRLWMDGLNLNVILKFLPIWFCHTAAIASTWRPVQNLSTALPARGCHVLQRVIGWELSCTCIVMSWSQRRRPKHGRLAMLTDENSPPKYNVGEKYVNLKMKT